MPVTDNLASTFAVGSDAASENGSGWTAVLMAFGAALVVHLLHDVRKQRRSHSSTDPVSTNIPWAPGAVPILGHALLYKKDPVGFLVRTCQQLRRQQWDKVDAEDDVGSAGNATTGATNNINAGATIFQLNLAGKHMILVCGPEEQKQVAIMPESVLSARQAVAEIGFEYTLGTKNVYEGTNLHKGIVKGIFHSPLATDRQVQAWLTAIRKALQVETPGGGARNVDFFHTIRRVTLRSTVEVMIGTAFLHGWDEFDFVSEFMAFQDALEDVTAKSVVLPRPLALVAMLWPLQRRRLALQKTIEGRLTTILAKEEDPKDEEDGRIGFWLQAVRSDHEVWEISEFIVGLLFAAHKNPAIGAAQTYLLLKEKAPQDALNQCHAEAQALLATPTWAGMSTLSSAVASSTTLRRACLESLRLTAHSIGAVRTAQQDVTLSVGSKLYKIPQGSTVGLAHIATSLDTTVWGDAAADFELSLSERADLYEDEYKFTTFSHGVHRCPGQQLALVMLQLTVAVLLEEYDVKLPDHFPPLCFERATLAQRKGPVMVYIQKLSVQ